MADESERFPCERCPHYWKLGGACKEYALPVEDVKRSCYRCAVAKTERKTK